MHNVFASVVHKTKPGNVVANQTNALAASAFPEALTHTHVMLIPERKIKTQLLANSKLTC